MRQFMTGKTVANFLAGRYRKRYSPSEIRAFTFMIQVENFDSNWSSAATGSA